MASSRRTRQRFSWATLRRLWPDLVEIARPQARLWALGLALLLLARLAGLVLPAAPKVLLDHAVPSGDMGMVRLLIGAVLAAAVIQGLCNFALTQTISKAGQRLIAALRLKLHRHVLRLPMRYFDSRPVGEVTSRILNDVEGIRNLVGTGMVEFLGGLITSAMALAILFWLNWQLTAALLVFVLLFLGLVVWSFRTLGPIFRERQEVMGEVSGRLTESIAAIRTVRSYNREEGEYQRFAHGVDKLLRAILRTINGISRIALFGAVTLGLLGATIIHIGASQLFAGVLTPGALISYLLYVGFMIAPMSSVLMIGTQLSEVLAGIDRMREVLGEAPEPGLEGREPIGRITGRIEARGVGFAYETGTPVLHDVSLTAEPGTMTAIVGPSGSGKTTLIGLLASFHSPTAGCILVDGRDLATVRLDSYRAQLGCVLQDAMLFSGTIRDNIAYARPDATAEQVTEAARLAHCLEFIERLPEGMETRVGERGVKLSGGQRQRVAIARALLADPRVLILDEATSNLDSESEAAIQEGLAHLLKGRTSFVIAHRLSTVRAADQIVVLESGRVVERGTHGELVARRGRYFEMLQRQQGLDGAFGEEETDTPASAPDDDSAPGLRRAWPSLLSGE